MDKLIQSIINTRELASEILAKSLASIKGLSELDIKNNIFEEIQKHHQIYPEGWYSPPPSGIVVLLDKKPFNRFLYDTLRKKNFWPKNNFFLEEETVGLFHISPVNKETNMFGDMGFTFYRGKNEKIKNHLKNSYLTILSIAIHAQAGMKFSELCEFAFSKYKNTFKPTRWITVNSDPNHLLNLGHTVPGSFEKNFIFGNNFESVKETIKTRRIYINDNENSVIPETCAFTVESRVEDYNDPSLPSTFFHFIVCIEKGKKTILDNFNQIFKIVGMDYIK